MIWHVFSAIRGIVVGIFMTEYRKKRYSSNRSSNRSAQPTNHHNYNTRRDR